MLLWLALEISELLLLLLLLPLDRLWLLGLDRLWLLALLGLVL